jgi:hypothetical protein
MCWNGFLFLDILSKCDFFCCCRDWSRISEIVDPEGIEQIQAIEEPEVVADGVVSKVASCIE